MAQVAAHRDNVSTGRGGKYLSVAEANAVIDGQLARRRAARLFYTVGLLLVLVAVAQAGFEALGDAPALRISRVKVEGVTGSLREEVRSCVTSFLTPQSSLLDLDTKGLRRLLEENPLLGDLRFEKHFPDTLVITAVRREPAALVSAGGFYLVDKEGRVMQKLRTDQLAKYEFPYFTGLPANEFQRGEKIYTSSFYRALELCRLLKDRNPQIYEMISEINLGGGDSSGSHQEHSLTAHMRGGAEVRLGDRSAAEILPVLDLFLGLLKEQNGELLDLAYVDLRYKDRIFYMDRPTFLASAAGVLHEAERLAAEASARQKKEEAKAEKKTKRLEQASKDSDERPQAAASAASSRDSALHR